MDVGKLSLILTSSSQILLLVDVAEDVDVVETEGVDVAVTEVDLSAVGVWVVAEVKAAEWIMNAAGAEVVPVVEEVDKRPQRWMMSATSLVWDKFVITDENFYQ